MKLPARIVVPVALAAFLAGVLIAFIWWQISQSTSILENPLMLFQAQEEQTAPLPDAPIDPLDKALVHMRQGDLLALRGEWKEAQAEYEKAVKAKGGLPALRKLAQAQMQRRDIIGVRSTLISLRNAGARPEDVILLESIVELRSGEFVKAKGILEATGDSPQKHYGLALLSIVEGNHETAQEELEKVINGWEPVLRSYARTLQAAYNEFALFPEGSNLHLITLLARALAQVQECELALPLLVQVTGTKDDYRDAWIVLGYCELVTERFEGALASLEDAYNIDPQKPEIQYFLARAYAELKQHQNAITFLEYAIMNGFEPESEARRLIAEEALESGDTLLALEQYEKLTENEDAPIETFDGFITASLALGNTEEAYLKAKEATERFPGNALAFELLGLSSIETDRNDEAKEAFKKALSINPDLERAKNELKKFGQ